MADRVETIVSRTTTLLFDWVEWSINLMDNMQVVFRLTDEELIALWR
jgi:hypothetical protein